MFLQNIQSDASATITSQQIAELVESRHDKVKQSIERLATTTDKKRASIALPPVGIVTSTVNNRTYETEVYTFSGEQGKRDSIIVVAQLSPEFTAALVDRWQELESGFIPKTLSSALRLAADQAEQIEYQQAQLAIAQPKAAALDLIAASTGSLNARDTAKTLNIQPKKFNEWAINHDWMYRDQKYRLQPHSQRIQQGFMEMRPVTYTNSNGEAQATTQALFTPKGLAHLAKIFSIVSEVA